MTVTSLSLATGKELRKLLLRCANALGEAVGALVQRNLRVHPVDVFLADANELLATLPRPHAVVRGALDKDFAGRTLHLLFDLRDAATMAGLLMLTPEATIEQRRSGTTLEHEDREAFGEVGNALCTALATVLREALANVDLRLQDHGLVTPGTDPGALLPSGPLVGCRLSLLLGDYPESSAWILLDRATAEAWNKGVLDDTAALAAERDEGGARHEEDLEDIPAAPIRGTLAAYVLAPELLRLLRRSCRRVGLELQRHSRTEIPNPAAHRGEIVLMDVPAGEERRFDWCRRIKGYGTETGVVLLLHRPSRARVAQAFLSHADVILGLPIEEPKLSQKLESLLGS
jgi:hypothetical protein